MITLFRGSVYNIYIYDVRLKMFMCVWCVCVLYGDVMYINIYKLASSYMVYTLICNVSLTPTGAL
jgi:hypothetical protein